MGGLVCLPHESQDPENQSNGFSANILDRTYIHGLTVISKPIPKVDTLHVKFGEFLPTRAAGHENVEQGVLDIAMAPILTLNGTDGS